MNRTAKLIALGVAAMAIFALLRAREPRPHHTATATSDARAQPVPASPARPVSEPVEDSSPPSPRGLEVVADRIEALDEPSQPGAFRFTVDRDRILALAAERAVIQWPLAAGAHEVVRLTRIYKDDATQGSAVFGDVIDPISQEPLGELFVIVGRDHIAARLGSPRGLASYRSSQDPGYLVGTPIQPGRFD